MKYFILPIISCCIASCATTAGSRDAADVPSYAAPVIAQSMTRTLTRYPQRGVPSPAGKPIYDAFSAEFESMGWKVTPTSAVLLRDEEMQRGYIRVFTSKLGNRRTLVELNTPYFSVYQVFQLNNRTGECFELSNPTILQKPL